MELNKIYNMDAIEGLKQLDDNSIDAIVSDPPYQLNSITRGREDQTEDGAYGREVPFSRVQAKKGFMNKEWDVLPSVEILKECLRVLKDGAFSLWLMTSRQDSQMEFLLRLREAGFVISFSPIYWTYATGFPKAENISKMVDKKLGVTPDNIGTVKGMGKQNPDFNGTNQGRKENYLKPEYVKVIPASEEAKKLDGAFAGFQPKPAVEIVIVAMKPLSEKSYVEQALKNEKGITFLGNCRIPYASSKDKVEIHNAPKGTFAGGEQDRGSFRDYRDNADGRFPANLLVSDNVLDIKSNGALAPVKSGQKGFGGFIYGKYKTGGDGRTFYSDKESDKSISRYFSLDAWWNERIKSLPQEVKKTFPFLYVPKASKSERNTGLEGLQSKEVYGHKEESRKLGIAEVIHNGKGVTKHNNFHPTVKPIKLMSYLITLTTQENDVVLDPFMGSGTTAISSILLNRKFIGFEREKEYFDIANARISYYSKQKKETTNKMFVNLDNFLGGEKQVICALKWRWKNE